MQIPLFPLSSVVMPGGLMPLRIFEKRYLDMIKNCFREQSSFGVCLVMEGAEVGPAATPYPYGTTVDIVDWDQGDNGLLLIVVEGQQKFRVVDTDVDAAQLLQGRIELLPLEASSVVPEKYSFLKSTLEQILSQLAPSIHYANPQYDDALWLGSRFVELLPLSAELRFELMSMEDASERLAAVADIIVAMGRPVK